MTTDQPPLTPDANDREEDFDTLPPAPVAWWKYVLPALAICLVLAITFRVLLAFATVAVVVLAAGALCWFAFWFLFSRRGIIGRRVHHRRMEARRRERWLRRAAEMSEDPK